jgi:hypothetical protein
MEKLRGLGGNISRPTCPDMTTYLPADFDDEPFKQLLQLPLRQEIAGIVPEREFHSRSLRERVRRHFSLQPPASGSVCADGDHQRLCSLE